ncbi:30S ribosomal protein S2 [Candidatus Saccharibacteria bacterium]|nr:30S ribosomal protein S2 [Candidatus Saccharibacteria bacterium]MBI3338383.1 30S ribosomal protein S2 [Candidatus Saccharibacteria bacterium]
MASTQVDIKKLLESGAHFGHKTSRWHPKMAPFIHSKRGGSHIIDLTKTVERLETALDFLEETAAEGKQILLVSTKRQAKDIVKETAERTGMPFVVNRWLGGMLTNRNTIGARIKYLKDLETRLENGQLASKYNKLEVQRFQEEIAVMNEQYGGIKNLVPRPGAVFIVDITHDTNAVLEARKLNLPIVALVDTNADPTPIDYPVPCNDDAVKIIKLIMDYVEQAITAGKDKYQKKADSAQTKADSKTTEKVVEKQVTESKSSK